MRSFRYIIAICTITMLSCKQKHKQTVKDAMLTESKEHEDANQSGNTTIAADKLIIPGKSIGQIALNKPTVTIVTLFGKPDFSDAAMGKSVSVWYDSHNKKSYSTHIYNTTNMGNDDTSRVQAVRISSPSFKTLNHVYAGVLVADAERLFKVEQLGVFNLNGVKRLLYDDVAAGIAFDVDRSGNITGVTVHQPGKSVLNAYQAFFGEVR